MSPNPLKRKYSSEDVDMGGVPQANGSTPSDDSAAAEHHRITPSFLHTDSRPDDFAHAGIRRGIALALDHVGFESADAVAVESFALATEECKAPMVRAKPIGSPVLQSANMVTRHLQIYNPSSRP